MKVLAVVLLLAAVLLDKSPPVTSARSLELTDVMLETLDLDRAPQKSNEKFDVPRYIMALYTTKARTGRLRSNDREIIRTFFRDERHKSSGDRHYFRFDLSAIKPQERLKRAELRIFKRKAKSAGEPRGHFLVSVSLLNRRWSSIKAGALFQRSMKVVTSKVVQNNRKGEWIVFEVLSTVDLWRRAPDANLGLLVSVHGMGVNSSLFEMGEKKRREPFLVTFSEKTSDNVKPRNREAENPLINRAEPTTTKNETMSGRRRAARSLRDNHCKKRNFVVELRKLGWEKWIVSPRTYNAHYCSGSCPAILHDFYNPSNHAILQSLLHHRVDSSIPCASCVPTRLHSISVLYRNDKIIELKTMGSMVVSTCGCR